MKKKSYLMKIVSLMLVLVLGLSMAIPTMAAGGKYSITITPADKFTWENTDNGRFVAYQIFSGVYTEDPVVEKGEENQLADITWGTGINGDTFVQALLAGDASDSFYKEFQTALNAVTENYSKNGKDLNDPVIKAAYQKDQAAAVAKVLSNHLSADDASFVIQFTRVAAKYVTAVSKEAEYVAPNFEIKDLDPGYYLVKDTYTPSGLDAVSQYILDVARDRNIQVKADVPTVDKKINRNNVITENGIYEIGEDIEFVITGTLPVNYGVYDEYFYKFVDTLPDTLTYHGNLKVIARNTLDDGSESDVDITKFVQEDISGQVLNFTVENLKAQEIAELVEITSQTKIIVTYNAYINENAVAGAPNLNKVHLEFSNDPNSESTGKTSDTPDDDATVYTFGLDISKQNADEEKLGGVGFKLYKKVLKAESAPGKPEYEDQYAILTKTTDESGRTVYKLVNSDDAPVWTTDPNGAGVIEAFTSSDPDTLGQLIIDGLGAGTYYLKETTKLDGYDTMKDIEVVITVTDDDDGNPQVNVTIADNRDDALVNGAHLDNSRENLTFINYKASILPSTGGIGTVIFYVAGTALLVGAVVFLIISAKKKKKATE